MADAVMNSSGKANTRSDVTVVTNTSSTAVERATALHGEIFKTDPVLNFLLYNHPTNERRAFIPKYIHVLMKSAHLNSGIFDEAAWYQNSSSSSLTSSTSKEVSHSPDTVSPPLCSAVWMPPNHHVDNWHTWWSSGAVSMMIHVGIKGIMRALGDFVKRSNAAKKKALMIKDEDGRSKMSKYWYLFFISTDMKARGKGVGAQVIRRMQAKVQNEANEANAHGQKALPIWLEATTADSRRLYARLGFQDVDKWVLGKGEVDERGEKCTGGEGVAIWAMVWWPV